MYTSVNGTDVPDLMGSKLNFIIISITTIIIIINNVFVYAIYLAVNPFRGALHIT